MAPSQPTPCSEFFGFMKKHGGISYKDLAKMILSGHPLSDGQSPASRVNDRSWVSRYVVHAPVGALQKDFFCPFSISAPRIVARLKAKKGKSFSSEQIMDLICGEEAESIIDALAGFHQNIPLYRNTMYRILNEKGFTDYERAEIAMVLFAAAACTGNVRFAVECAIDFSKSIHGVGMSTPMLTPVDSGDVEAGSGSNARVMSTTLGLMRMMDGYVVGNTHWIDSCKGTLEIGAMAMDDDALNDVGMDVSAHHARITRAEDGTWMIEDLGSSNGTFVTDGVTGVESRVIATDAGAHGGVIEIHPGDELRFGTTTTFAVVEGVPEA